MKSRIQFAMALAGALTLGLTACGKSGSSSETGEGSPSSEVLYAKDADNASEAMDVYVSQMDRIASAMESVEDEASAKTAAEVIQSATKELDLLSKKFDSMSDTQKTAWAMTHAQKLQQVQMRIGLALQKISAQNPEQMQMLSQAMSDLPDVE